MASIATTTAIGNPKRETIGRTAEPADEPELPNGLVSKPEPPEPDPDDPEDVVGLCVADVGATISVGAAVVSAAGVEVDDSSAADVLDGEPSSSFSVAVGFAEEDARVEELDFGVVAGVVLGVGVGEAEELVVGFAVVRGGSLAM